MRWCAASLLVATLLSYGCSKPCDMTRCPDDLNRADMSVAFYDGSANGYVFRAGWVEYIPVKLGEGSTLTYSGGAPFTRPIDMPTFAKIAKAFNAAIDAKAAHIQERVMMSGVISVRCGDKEQDWVIAPKSPELTAIEALLTELKASNR